MKTFTIHKNILSSFPPNQPAKIPTGKLMHNVTTVISAEIISDSLVP